MWFVKWVFRSGCFFIYLFIYCVALNDVEMKKEKEKSWTVKKLIVFVRKCENSLTDYILGCFGPRLVFT